jgi:RNAse (barnase) inhibitor barstar
MSRDLHTAGLTDGSHRSGIYRLVQRPTAIAAALEQAGWRVGVAAETASRGDFFDRVRDALEFPSYFGANLDALWDCLTDLTVPTALVLSGWGRFAVTEPQQWHDILTLFEERTRSGSPFAVILA